MKKLLTIGLPFICLVACHRATVPQATQAIKDSIVYKVVAHDTTISIPASSIWIDSVDLGEPVTTKWLREHPGVTSGTLGQIYKPRDFDTTAINGNVKLHVNISHGHLTASCKADSLQQVIKFLSESLEKYHVEKQIIQVPVKVPVNHIPKWVWYLLGANILIAAWTFRNPLITVFKRFL